MRILVFSDSHSGLSQMRRFADAVKPDGIIHLGDHYDDGEAIREEYPDLRFFWQVPGNCDRYRAPLDAMEILQRSVQGVQIYLTHGHLHKVKLTLLRLLQDARAASADIVLFGHTHEAYCRREEDGLWVMNPGACGSWGGSAGLIELEDGIIKTCRVIRGRELEEWK